MATRLFVGNVAENCNESDLRAAFSNYGEIIHLDLKSKSAADNESKKFAFVTISGSNYDIESCMKHFSNEDFNGSRLYVTRARESFLERLQRERQEAQQREEKKNDALIEFPTVNSNLRNRKKNEALTNINHKSLDDTKNLWKRNVPSGDEPNYKISGKTNKKINILDLEDNPQIKIDNHSRIKQDKTPDYNGTFEIVNAKQNGNEPESIKSVNILDMHKKKDSDMKRMEAMKKKRQEFRNKQMIVKTGLTSVDKVPNKKIKFTIDEDESSNATNCHETKLAKTQKRKTLFDDDKEDSGDELNFEIKKQFEGKKGQMVLDLQSRYKSDKRFVLDERFIEEDETEKSQETVEAEDEIEINQGDEKDKQLNILQDVLGVSIRRKVEERDGKKNKPKLGMLRFDPSQPEHAKFLAPVEDTKPESRKKCKKKKDKQTENTEVQEQKQDEPRPEVSKEQFYKVSDTLKEAIVQPTTFSLRSLFGNVDIADDEPKKEEDCYILPLEPPKKSKVKNPLAPHEKNPFVYDSSDSENEEIEKETVTGTSPVVTESKAIWKENFFFGLSDQRFEEGLAFLSSANEAEAQKERRELKSLMKKRIYNKERKDQMQMFQKKIGGRKKTMKKSFRKKN